MHLPLSREMGEHPEGSSLLEEYNKEADYNVSKVQQPSSSFQLPSMEIPRGSTIHHHSRRFLWFLIPTFIQHRLRPSSKPTKLHPTAFLDGMRGLAALLVFFYHFASCTYDIVIAYDAGKEGENREILKMPFIRILYAGPAMVSIFYVVSGYALSYKPVKLMRNKAWKDLMHTIASSTFRRAIRLYLPCIISTFGIVFLVRFGWYDWGRSFAESKGHFNNKHIFRQQRFDTLWAQLKDWTHQMWVFIHPWSFGTKDTDITLDGHLWTIAIEFRSSLILYLTQAGVARLKSGVRVAVLTSLIIWCTFKDRWEMILFYAGFLLAELDFRRRAAAAATAVNATAPQRPPFWNSLYIAVFILGIYLGGQPQKGAEHSPGWAVLSSWVPSFVMYKHRYWVGWGAIMMVWSTSNSASLQRLFVNGPVQYLGKISFALYVMHGPVTHSLGFGVMNVMWNLCGWETTFTKAFGFGVAGVVTLGATIWSADIFMRAVDTPSVKFAKWLEEKCSVDSD